MTQPSRYETAATVALLLLAVVASALGLLRDGHYVESGFELLRLQAQDAVVLFLGVPALAVGLWLAVRGSLRGRLIWLGSLAFMAYMWTHYAFVVSYNDFFLGYVALFALAVFTLLSGIATTNSIQVYDALHDEISTRLYVVFLAVAAVGLTFMWLFDIVPALLVGEPPSAIAQFGPEAAHTYVIDLGILVPSLAITAIWLHRSRPWGYVCAGVLLVFAALIAPTLTAITVVDMGEGIEISAPILVGTIVPPLLGLLFAGAYLRRLSEVTS
ncbi:hypothetical protein [Natronococcus sp. A-GB7]|uniref:hypothetical protein n=1 Tax=Natronococcus sp. A-GB7 TaxID=3037649 RepID=UPI00241F26B6|nr:hypothetical protein [Natronococcus sp. A-GB7]MDG5818186.1 hypothetical protein [Natronococcus sp. A-GB7]